MVLSTENDKFRSHAPATKNTRYKTLKYKQKQTSVCIRILKNFSKIQILGPHPRDSVSVSLRLATRI